MTRLGSQIACVALGFGAALWGCGSNTTSGDGASSALEVVPASGAISGWTINPASTATAGKAAATATTEVDTEALIDGAAADFFAAPSTPKQFAWQEFVSSTVTDAPDGAKVTLYVLQMPSADQAKSLYTSLLKASLYSRKVGTTDDWKEPSSPLVGTDSRLQDTGDHWWINFYKGNFYVEVSLSPSAGPAPDFTPGDTATRDAAFSFAAEIAKKL